MRFDVETVRMKKGVSEMKKITLVILVVMGFVFVGCEERATKYVEVDYVPATPQGVYSVTGDQAVYLFWLPVRESDMKEYRIYRSPNDNAYILIGTTTTEAYTDLDVENGVKYYYAILAVDKSGNESDLSYETVFDTPRPEGQGLLLADFNVYPGIAGYDFSYYAVVPYNNINADIYIEYNDYDSVFYINVTNALTDIQDMGYTENFDVIDYAPTAGWSHVGWSEIITGHTYVIWTKDDHYAKFRVTNQTAPYNVRFDWGYQIASGNPELARPQHDENYLRRTITMGIIK